MKIKYKTHAFSVLLFTALAATLRTAALLLRYEPTIGYLRADWLSVASTVILLLGLVWCTVCPALLASKNPPALHTALSGRRKTAWSILYATAATCCFFGGLSFLTNRTSNSMILYILTGLFSIALAIFFLVACTPDTTKSASKFAELRPWFHIAGIFMLLFLLISSYFDMTVTINGPFSSSLSFSLLFGCLFFLMEIREEIGSPAKNLHYILTCSSLYLSLAVGISNLIFSLFGAHGDGITIAEPARPTLLIAVGLAAVARLLCYSEREGSIPPIKNTEK